MTNNKMLHESMNASKLLNMTCDTLLMLTNDGTLVDAIIKTDNLYINESTELIGKNIFDVFPESTNQEFRPEFEEVVLSGKVSNKNYDLPSPDKMFYFKCIMQKYDDKHVLCQYRDITQRSQMKLRLKNTNRMLVEVERAAKIGHWHYDTLTKTFEYTGFVNGAYGNFEDEVFYATKVDYIGFVHPDYKDAFVSFFEKETEVGDTVEYRLVKNGKSSFLWCKLINKRMEGDRMILEGYTQNISTIVERQQEMEMVLSIVNNFTESIYANKMDGTLVFANKRCRLQNNIDLEADVTQLKVYDALAHLHDKDAWNVFMNSITSSSTCFLNYVVKHHYPQFNIFASDCTSSFIKNRFGDDIVWTLMRDISSQLRYEERLKKAKEVAEESNRLKTAFISNMTHEIRTPLNAIVGFSGIIAQTNEQKQRDEYYKIVQSNSFQLTQLINEVLDLSQMESESVGFNVETISLNKFGEELEMTHRLTCDSVDLVFDKPDTDHTIYAEKIRIAQVLSNLITNAIKFTPTGSIHFGYTMNPDQVEFYVKDTGIGIKPEYLDKVFDRFVKINAFAKGTGLGLAISKTIVEKMGGKMSVESVFNKGTTFRFTVPIK